MEERIEVNILLERAEAEIVVKKSRFIAIAIPCHQLEEIKPAIKELREMHPDARHVVHAAVLGRDGTLFSSSDDKEPKNTAGRPALEVLKGSGITDILVCIIRYFGGTLLGTGGLVTAYGDSVKEVLKVVRTEPLVDRTTFRMDISYEFCNQIKRLLTSLEAVDITEDYGSGITIKGRIARGKAEELKSSFTSITMGRCTLTLSE